MVQDYQKAEDLTQEVFLKILKKKYSYNTKKKFSSWLYKIATNSSIDALRHSKFQVKMDEKEMQKISQDTFKNPEKDFEAKEKEALVKDSINSLSPEHKALIILQQYQGLKYEEIALALGKDFNWVKWHLKLIYDELGSKLKDKL
jgi:RNA polymerase sigma-70 factor (ECF subfamily)